MAEPKQEFWRWREDCFVDPDMDWRKAQVVTLGIDVGSVSSQALVCLGGKLYAYNTVRTGANSPESARNAMAGLFEKTGMKVEDLHYIVGTGYGRVNIPFANKAITEIACHGRGANYMAGPRVRTILDMGGQDCKAIHIDDKGKVTNFLMNDKCAAGTGRGMEVISDLLEVPIAEIGPAIARTFHVGEAFTPEARREAEIDETRPLDRHLGKQTFRVLHTVANRLRDGARRLARLSRQVERNRGRQIAKGGILRKLQKQRGKACQLQPSPFDGVLDRALKQPFNPFFHPPLASDASRVPVPSATRSVPR